MAEAEVAVAGLVRETRDLGARAQAIEDAVYDLKAVNPHVKKDADTRTPEDLLNLIEAKGREVAEALATLRDLTGRGRPDSTSMTADHPNTTSPVER